MDALKGALAWAGVGVATALLAAVKRIAEAAQLADAFGKNEHA